MSTKQTEIKQELLLPCTTTVGSIMQYSAAARAMNMTLAEYTEYCMRKNELDSSFSENLTEEVVASSTQKENSESPNLQTKKLHNN